MQALSVLYVEDNDDLRELFATVLEQLGCEATCCARAEEALALWRTRAFDVLFADVNLPGLSGVALAQQLLASKADQWVVLCSGASQPPEVHALGPNVRVLIKPFDIETTETLMAAIARSLGRDSPGGAAA